MTLIYYIYPRTMTRVNMCKTVGMSATVGEMSATVGKCFRQWGNVRNSRGNFRNSGEIEYGIGNLTVQIIVHYFERLHFRIHGVTYEKPIRI